MPNTIRINQIFESIDGEVNGLHQGCMTTFIRFQGCNLECLHCDTQYAQELIPPKVEGVGNPYSVEEILESIDLDRIYKVTITGGEPLLQMEGLVELCRALYLRGIRISVETNGTILPEGPLFEKYVDSWVVDYKLPSSGVKANQMRVGFFSNLLPNDIVKFVVQDGVDVQTAIEVMHKLKDNGCEAKFAFSPMLKYLSPALLFEWLQFSGVYNAIISVQLHKLINME